MEVIYGLIQENPKYFAWIFAVVNVLWGIFLYFNKQSHDRKMAKLSSSLAIEKEEKSRFIIQISELEEVAGQAKEIVTSYRSTPQKKELFIPFYKKLDEYSGKFSKYPLLMQSIRNLNHYCSIMVEDNPPAHDSYRDEVLQYYKDLIIESEKLSGASKHNNSINTDQQQRRLNRAFRCATFCPI